MDDRTSTPRPPREIPRYSWAIPEARPQHKLPLDESRQQPRRVVFLRGSWWVWLSIGIGIGLAVVANALAGKG